MMAIIHAWRLENVTEEQLRSYYKEIISVTSDMGTELSTTEFPNLPHSDLGATALPSIVDDSGDALMLDASGQGSDLQTLLPFSLKVPGMMHVLANATKQVHTSLHVWEDLKTEFSEVASFLHVPDNRRRMQSCLYTGRLQVFASFFDTACPLLKDWRWLYVLHVTRHLLGLENALKAGWELRAYLKGNSNGNQPINLNDEELAKLRRITASIQSTRPCAYFGICFLLGVFSVVIPRILLRTFRTVLWECQVVD
jgi:hypothetical protein